MFKTVGSAELHGRSCHDRPDCRLSSWPLRMALANAPWWKAIEGLGGGDIQVSELGCPFSFWDLRQHGIAGTI